MRALAILAIALLAGCASTAERQQARLNNAHQLCQNAGIKPGQDGYSNCVLTAYDNATARQQHRADTMTATGLYLLSISQPPPVQPAVVCRRNYYGTICQ